jgi:hypothetical protein
MAGVRSLQGLLCRRGGRVGEKSTLELTDFNPVTFRGGAGVYSRSGYQIAMDRMMLLSFLGKPG